MEDYEKEGEETSARGVDWEVVSLTASAYAAEPGPEGISLSDDTEDKENNKNEEEYARAMFMSGHFVFPPSEHENLPIQSDVSENVSKIRMQDTDMIEVVPDVSKKIHEENWSSESISEANDLRVVQLFDKDKRLLESEEGIIPLQGLDLIKEVTSTYSNSGFSSFNSETDMGRSVMFDENSDFAELDDPINQDTSCSPKPSNNSKYGVSGVPIESWWKRRAALLYAQATEASTIWSLCVAAALMGLVILGQRWQRERWQAQQIRSHFSTSDEKIIRLMGPVTRFKDAIVGSHRRTPVLQVGSSSGH